MMHIALLYIFFCTHKEMEKEHNIMIKTGQQIIIPYTPDTILKYHKFNQNVTKYNG